MTDQDPLRECSNFEEEDAGRSDHGLDPVINYVGSLRAEDIDEIDIFEEEPRALVSSSRSRPRRLSETIRRARPLDYKGQNRATEQDFDVVQVDVQVVQDVHRGGDWQDVEEDDDEDEDYEDDEESSVVMNEWNEDELEEVEIYGESIDGNGNLNPNLNAEGNYRGVNGFRLENKGKFKCNFPACAYSSQVEKNLQTHTQSAHDASSMHVCGFCVCRYKTKSDLTHHLKRFHHQYGQSRTVPQIVKVSFNGKNRFKCTACGYTCKSQHPLKIHVHSAHDPNGKYGCPHCVCQYAKKNHLTQHVAKYHSVNSPFILNATAAASKSTVPSAAVLNSYAINKSLPSDVGPSPNASVEVVQVQSINGTVIFNRIVTNRVGKYYCRVCSYSTLKRGAMIKHMEAAHNPNGKHLCPHCTCRYNLLGALQKHLKRVHPDKPRPASLSPSKSKKKLKLPLQLSTPFQSPETPLIPAATQDSYKLVMINNQILYKCVACGFMSRDLIQTHKHIHNSHGHSARYFCQHCTFRFSFHDSFAIHLARVHPETVNVVQAPDEPRMEIMTAEGVTVYKCKLCLYVIPTQKKCLTHIQSHCSEGKYACDLCSCRFLHSSQLGTHKGICHRDINNVSADPDLGIDRDAAFDVPLSTETTKTAAPSKPTNGMNQSYSTTFVNGRRTFLCIDCGLKSISLSEMNGHIKAAHNPSNPFKCRKCTCRYALKVSLAAHMARKHKLDSSMPILSPVQSSTCSIQPEKSPIEAHKSFHQANKYCCSLCSCRFPSNESLMKHMTTDHDHAGVSNSKTSGSNSERYREIIQNGLTKYKCTHPGCGFVNESNIRIRTHVASSHNLNRSLAFSQSQGRLDKHKKKLHNIGGLEATSTNPSDLLENSADVIKDKVPVGGAKIAVLRCQISGCGFETRPQDESILENHMKTAHSPTAKYKCDQCPCRYNSKNDLTQHANTIHAHLEPTQSGNDAAKLKRDSRENESTFQTSSPGKPYKCKFCDFSTTSKGGFVTHLTASHSAKNPHKCSHCPCQFATVGGLTSHEYRSHKKKLSSRPHKGLSEGMQNSSAVSVGTTNLHKSAVLSTAKKHPCTLCSSTFNNNSSLNWHIIRVHTVRNPDKPTFPCEICGNNYNSDKGLGIHKAKTHGIESTPPILESVDVDAALPPEQDTSLIDAPEVTSSPSSKAKAARKYAEVEGPQDLESDSDVDDLFQMRIVKKDLPKVVLVDPSKPPKTTSKRQCSKCSYISDAYNVTNHEMRAHIENGHKCTLCPCSFATMQSLKLHSTIRHKKKFGQESEENMARNSSKKSNRNAVQASAVEISENPSISNSVSNGEEMDTCSSPPVLELESTEKSKNSSPVPKITLHRCPICTFTCRLPVNLVSHKMEEHVKGGYVCKYCRCSYLTTQKLDQHLQFRHKKHISVEQVGSASSVKVVKTELENEELGAESCAETVNSPSQDDLQKPGLDPSGLFKCSIAKCSFSTKRKVDLTTHLKMEHRGSNRCEKCNRSFMTKSVLDGHMLTFHKQAITPSSLNKCSECSFTTLLRVKLKQHEKIHKTGLEVEASNDNEVSPLNTSSHPIESGDDSDSLRETFRKRKSDDAVGLESYVDDLPPNELSLEPAAKQRKVPSFSEPKNMNSPAPPPFVSRPSKRLSAEKAKKIINSVIRSEQMDEEEEEYEEYGDYLIGGPENKKIRVETASAEKSTPFQIENQELSKQAETFQELIEKTIESSTSHIIRQAEIATLERPTERIALKQAQVSTKRTAGLREFMKFTCSRCAESFDTIMQLTTHFQKCKENLREFTCRLCDNNFISLLKMKEHVWKTHMVEEDKRKSEMQRNGNLKSGHPYVCSLCKLGLKERKSYILHMSLPHLFRCKRCSFVCCTKTDMDVHKNDKHPKPLKNQPTAHGGKEKMGSDDDNLLIVFESVTSVSTTSLKNKRGSAPGSDSLGKLSKPLSGAEDEVGHDHENGKEVNIEVEPNVEESLICDECGNFSHTVEEARQHSRAIMDIESLICFICGYMSSNPCDSVLHAKSHQENEDGDECADHDVSPNAEDTTVPEYSIEVEFEESPSLIQGLDAVDVPLVANDHAQLDPNSFIIFEGLKEL